MAEPESRCGACDQVDDHPKHSIMVGFGNPATAGEMFHKHDDDRDGVIHYHFDCPSPWHDLHANLPTVAHQDPEEPTRSITEETAAAHLAVADHHARVVALARSGVHGDELRLRIVNGEL